MSSPTSGVSIPVFVSGLFLAYFFAVVLKGTPFALPPSGRLSAGVDVMPLGDGLGAARAWTGPRGRSSTSCRHLHLQRARHGPVGRCWDAFRHLILPAIALGTIPLAIIARITRRACSTSSASTTSGRPGRRARERTVICRHGLRNAILPVVTIVGLQLGASCPAPS